MMDKHGTDAAALAALTICENLIAVLMDREVLTREDVEELLSDAAAIDTGLDEAGEVIRDIMEGLTARPH